MQDSTLADRLRKLRGNTPRKAFSLKYGIHEQSLIRYEKGTRTPDNEIIRRIALGENVSFDWLLSGVGPENNDDIQNDRHVGRFEKTLEGQPVEFFRSEDKGTTDMSAVLVLQQQLLDSLREQNRLLQENANLRLQLERRDQRIRELEKENAGLREAQKGPAFVRHTAAGEAN